MRNENVRRLLPDVPAYASVGLQKLGDVAELHYHDEIELLAVRSGEFICTAEGVEYRARAGEVIFINSRIPHATACDTPGTELGLLQVLHSPFIGGDEPRTIRYSVRLMGRAFAPVKVMKDENFYLAVTGAIEELMGKKHACEAFAKAHIYKLLGTLIREGCLADEKEIFLNSEVQKVLPVLNYLNENYAEGLSLDEASALLNFDKSYFCRIFRRAIGATFTEYLNFVRICKAEKLLSKTDKSVIEISEAVGFSSVSYFNRVFRKYCSSTPREYRMAKYCNM